MVIEKLLETSGEMGLLADLASLFAEREPSVASMLMGCPIKPPENGQAGRRSQLLMRF